MHPITASASGKNAYYMGHCRHTEQNPAYAACLDKIRRTEARERVDETCASAIRHGSCQAVHMRKAEELAGHALYFVPRDEWQKGLVKAPPWSVPPERRECTPGMDALLGQVNGSEKLSLANIAAAVDEVQGGYADAINAAMQEATPTPEPSVVPAHKSPVTHPPIQPGESPIQYARRVAAARTTQENQ